MLHRLSHSGALMMNFIVIDLFLKAFAEMNTNVHIKLFSSLLHLHLPNGEESLSPVAMQVPLGLASA